MTKEPSHAIRACPVLRSKLSSPYYQASKFAGGRNSEDAYNLIGSSERIDRQAQWLESPPVTLLPAVDAAQSQFDS
jgi:hypothetical protein